MGSGGPVGLTALEHAAAELAAEQLDHWGPAGLGDQVRRLRRVIDRLEADGVRRLARFNELDGPRSAGATNANTFLQYQCGLDSGGAAERVLLADTRELVPAVTAEAAAGRISFDQAAIIARGATEVKPADAPLVESRALEMALGGSEPRRLRHMTKAIVAEIDSGTLERDQRRAHARRCFRIGQDRDGSVHVEGLLESECAAYLRAVTDALMGPKASWDDRSGPQRRHDALLEALKKLLAGDAKLPRVGGHRPHITVVAPLSAMLGEPGPPALLQGLVPISREHLLRLAEEGTLSATLVHANGREAYSGKARAFTAAMRRSMAARKGTCEWPGGCDRPIEWCDGHHVDPYAEGGLTAPEHGELYCGFHHGLLETGGWAIVRTVQGGRRAVPPGDPDNPRTPLVAFAEASSGGPSRGS